VHLTAGPYRFSERDVRRTLAHGFDFLDGFAPEARVHQAARRDRIAAALSGVAPLTDPISTLGAPLGAVWAELLSARDDLIAAGALPISAVGRVVRLGVSDGGVPKRAVDRATAGFDGLVGDRQSSRRHHGAPFQALCIWNVETIAELADRGHPIGPGDAGENVTAAGLDWPSVRPGVRLELGSVLCEVSSYAEPCKQNARWFSDRDFTRIHDRNGPWSRVYATVLEPGVIAVDDEAVLEPGQLT
jgi:MOSC domain-containing protein YiiM